MIVKFLKNVYQTVRERIHGYRSIKRWKDSRKLGPPPHEIKQKVIRDYARRFAADTLIETGTYLGEMVHAQRRHFRKIISIELDAALFEMARQKFRKYSHITVMQGDSGIVLPQVLTKLSTRCLFWLDGHYSGGNTARGSQVTPVLEELHHIRDSGNDAIILIDDARLFQNNNGYPSLGRLKSVVHELWPGAAFVVEDDIIRIHPRP